MSDIKHPWVKTNWDTALDDAVTVGLTGIALTVERRAALNAPVGQYPAGSGRVGGRLRGSITYAVKGKLKSERSKPNSPQNIGSDGVSMPGEPHTAYVGTNVEYAPYVEYGTRRGQRAQRYLTRALDETRTQFKGIFQKAIRDAVLKHGK